MIPLLLLVLGAGAFAAYELSSKTHTWVDEHVQLLRAALIAHRAADAHLDAAARTPDPAVAVQQLKAAQAANQIAAQMTAQAAQAAKTLEQQAAAAQSAAAVVTRADKILAWIEHEHGQAIQDAGVAHQIADMHLEAAATAPDPTTVAQHVEQATTANQVAAHKTVQAVETARTPDQRVTAAKSAVVVDARAAVLAKLGQGVCPPRHSYSGVTAQKKDAIIAKLRADGKTITGNNPWDIDSHMLGIKLRAIWNPDARTLHVVVSENPGKVACHMIWEEIDPALKKIIAS